MSNNSNSKSSTTAQAVLRSYVERAERLNAERKELADDLRDLYAEAKNNGFVVKALKAVIRLREQDANERREDQAVLETYLAALGMSLNQLSDEDMTMALPEFSEDDLPPLEAA